MINGETQISFLFFYFILFYFILSELKKSFKNQPIASRHVSMEPIIE